MNPALPPPRALRGKIKVHLPKTEQVDDFDCGPAALWSILRYYGCEIGDYDAFLKECDATKKDGTDPEDLVRVAKKYGLLTKEVHGMTIKHLERVLQEGKPVIINLQAWGQEKYYRKLQSGHYATAIGFDDKRIYFEDPSLHTRKRGSILKKKLLERWRDRKADGEILNHYGIIAWKEQAGKEGASMRQRINPVLPPPRRLLNPVDALLTARSPAQVRLHFARYRRAVLYEWERDPKYKGAKGSKWVGTGDDAGKSPRYQESKPGAGRGGKKEGSPAPKKEGKAVAAAGGKPSKKDAHADIVQHLRDVLSGEGEEADALFAKLQDRLAGMSPAERKEAAEKLGGVLGGKKPAAKREPKAKPGPKQPAAPGFAEVGAAVKELSKRGAVKIPEVLDTLKKSHPSLTQEQFHGLLKKLKDEDKITLEIANSPNAEIRSGEGIQTSRGLQFYVHLNEDPPAPASKQPAEKPAPAKRTPAAAKKKPEGAEKPKEKAPAKEKPQPKPGKIADKPTPGRASGATPEQVGDALKDAMDYLKLFAEHRDGLIGMNRVYHELVKRVPDLTKEQFHNLVWQLSRDYKVELHVLNEPRMASQDARDHAIGKNDRMYSFVLLKPDVKSGKDLVPSKPAGADKEHTSWSEAASQPAPVPGSPVHEPPRLPEPPKSGELEGHKGRLKGLVEKQEKDPYSVTDDDADAEVAKLQKLPTPHLKELVESLGLKYVKPTRKDMLSRIRGKLTEARRARESFEV